MAGSRESWFFLLCMTLKTAKTAVAFYTLCLPPNKFIYHLACIKGYAIIENDGGLTTALQNFDYMNHQEEAGSMTRFVPIGKTMNLRHMGGYDTDNARKTKENYLYRSGFLHFTGDQDLAKFESLGISTIYDFRSPMERVKNDLQVGDSIEVVELGMLVASVENLWDMLMKEGLNPEGAEKIMGDRYRELTEEEVPGYRKMFDHMMESEGGILVMCSFGKDRAGIASALLLSALGVKPELVEQDYLLSSEAYADKALAIGKFEQFFNSEGLSVDESIVVPILDARTKYLATAWQVMREKSGSLDNFMREELGIDQAAREYLQKRFTL